MEQISRKVSIMWKFNPTTFEIINKDVVGEHFRIVGSSVSAVTKILQHSDMLKDLMPKLLTDSLPDSRDVTWDRSIRHYWDSLSVDIPGGGRNLETGFAFTIDHPNKQSNIKELLKKNESIKTNSQLASFVMGFTGDTPNVPEQHKWKYGDPINPEDYLFWFYCLNYRCIANTVDDINKSTHIRFYLHTDEEREKAKRKVFKTKQEALNKYMNFIRDSKIDDINDVLSLLTPDSIVDITKSEDMEKKQMDIMTIVEASPEKFVNVIDDKNLKTKAFIERLVAFDVLKKLPNSTVIVEAADPSVVVGNNLDEAVGFISNEKNKVKVGELTAKYKSLIG